MRNLKLTKQQIEAVNDEIDHVYHNMLIEDDEESADIDDDLPALEHVIGMAEQLIEFCQRTINENTLVQGMRVYIPDEDAFGEVHVVGSEDCTVSVDGDLEPRIFLHSDLECIGATRIIQMIHSLGSNNPSEQRIHAEVIRYLAKGTLA